MTTEQQNLNLRKTNFELVYDGVNLQITLLMPMYLVVA